MTGYALKIDGSSWRAVNGMAEVAEDEKFSELQPDPISIAGGEINVEAREYLTMTDWYIIRHQETGQAIPEEILQQRAAARGRITNE